RGPIRCRNQTRWNNEKMPRSLPPNERRQDSPRKATMPVCKRFAAGELDHGFHGWLNAKAQRREEINFGHRGTETQRKDKKPVVSYLCASVSLWPNKPDLYR